MPTGLCIVSPWSKALRNGKKNPKNYPWWKQLVKLIPYKTVQIGVTGEELIDCDEVLMDASLDTLGELIAKCDTWISVDNFFPHLAALYKKPGIVIFGQSDPRIFGYKQNRNILKDRLLLRDRQFDIWEAVEYSENVFPTPEEIISESFSND